MTLSTSFLRSHLLPLGLGLCLAAAASAQITPGNVVVVRVGDGTTPLASSVAAPVFLDEFTPAGALVQSIALPTAVNGSNRACTSSGTATSEGHLNLSPNGQYLTCTGYDAIPGTTALLATASTAVNRVVARIDLQAAVDTSTAIDNAFSGSNIRSAVTDDGAQFWAIGANSGVQYATLGGTSASPVSTGSPTNIRTIGIANGQLYVSSASGAFQGVSMVGAGLPTSSGNSIALLAGFPTASGPSAYDFYFADASTVYVADDRTNGNGGIQKWTESAGTWTLQYTLALASNIGCRGVSGQVTGGIATLFATTSTSELATVTDTGVGSVMVSLATAPTNTAFRGLRLLRSPSLVSHAGTGSPTSLAIPALGTAGGLPVTGNPGLQITAGNLVPSGFGIAVLGIGYVGAGIQIPGAPATALLYVLPSGANQLVLADANGDGSIALPIPALPAIVGLPLQAQLLAYDAALPDPLPIGTSDRMQIVIGN